MMGWIYLSGQVSKTDVFLSRHAALDWLISKNTERLENARNEVKRLEDSLSELEKMLEGA